MPSILGMNQLNSPFLETATGISALTHHDSQINRVNLMTKKILIVAQDRTIRLMAGITLELEDYEIFDAPDMAGAMEKIGAGLRPDVILNGLDFVMSNGVEFVMAVRKLSDFRCVPILVLADETILRRQAEWREVGITGWIPKPFTGRQLIEMVGLVIF